MLDRQTLTLLSALAWEAATVEIANKFRHKVMRANTDADLMHVP